MKKVIIAIERANFINLYKFDRISVSPKNIIKFNYGQLISQIEINFEQSAIIVEEALPYFSREEDNILIEVDRTKIDFEYSFPFSSVHSIITLNQMAKDLVEVKLNTDFKIESPLPEGFFSKIVEIRELKLRNKAARDVLRIFELNIPNVTFINAVEDTVASKLKNIPFNKDSTISVLINFDTTPSGIPSGNVEPLMKIIATGLLKAVGKYDTLRKSPLYNFLYENYEEINNLNKEDAFTFFNKLATTNRESFEKLYSVLRDKSIEGEILKFCYYFFLIKIYLLKAKGDLENLKNEVSGIDFNKKEFSQALYLIAFMQSYNVLFESIHRLKYVPLFGKKKPSKEVQYNSPSDSHKNKSLVDLYPMDEEVSKEAYNQSKENPSESFEHIDNSNESSETDLFTSLKEKNQNLNKSNILASNTIDNLYKKALEKVKTDGYGGKEMREILLNLKNNQKSISYGSLREAFENEEKCKSANGSFYKKVNEVLELFKG